ncbi:putative MFS family arabinose efflux permease [Streptomyces sp. KhCrAH-43]|uniref:MFS transporter n=1 Tax=unclassified Streptomyces TaxID=2593676 RepID=UPI0003798280|nr:MULTISPECIES: MFS transporter [unclassified Streptomyces]MYS37553.1 MFS transporter [Streptomyces sp. SID4920]MYX67884.1 MFS transporter [Streptomyces sp. SID8373]RAJ56945.1 putative MFS family arabinose efflux permease [Streptomyces sp. KhCrAH-43]
MSEDIRVSLLRRHRDFRLLWCGEVTGKFGSSVRAVAMPLIAVSTLHASTWEVGLLSASAWLPWLLIGLPAGAWVDRMRRRPVMLSAAAVSFLLFALIPVTSWSGHLSVALLVGIALLTGTAAVFFQTAYTAYLPSILDPEDQPEGNAKLHGSASAAQIGGLGSAGLIVQAVGVVNAMFANAATFLVSFLCIAGIRRSEPRRERNADRPAALLSEVGEGLRLVARDPWIRALTLFGASSNLALMGYQSIQVIFLVDTVGLAPGAVGGLIAASSTGGVAGAFVARRVADRVGTARAMLMFELGFALFALLIPTASEGVGLVLFATGGFCVAAGVVAGNVIKSSFQQRYCPPELLGRITASTAFLNFGTMPLGALLGGWLGTAFDLRTAMWITTAGVPLAALVLLFSPIGRTRDLPTAPGATDTSAPAHSQPSPS